ncbi:MAG: AAA family ATPase [Thainema sp.]
MKPEQSESQLILLIGLPGSGKSTWAQALQQFSQQQPDAPAILISTDRIRATCFGNEAVQGAWPVVWRAVEQQFQQAVQLIQSGQSRYAIYDATNAARKQRRLAIQLAHQVGFQLVTGIWIDTPLALCLARNQQRDRTVPEAVILKMQRQLWGAPPNLDEGLSRLVQIGSQQVPTVEDVRFICDRMFTHHNE